MAVNRINTLDYLRGLMALGIMIYHYYIWTFNKLGADSIIGITGVYGVSVFYILSGLTLYHVYNKSLKLQNTLDFFIKRIFRILPLLWLSVGLNIFLLNKSYDFNTVFLNLTGLFGYLDHDNYVTTGAWSIGNELVFYSLFPLIIISSSWKHYLNNFFFIISLIVGLYFAYFKLVPTESLSGQWSNYINPLNQIYLFAGGSIIAKYLSNKKNNFIAITFLLLCVLFIILYQVDGDLINLVTGNNRIYFSACAFTLTSAFYLIDIKIHKLFHWLLLKLGHISYSIYLMHAIIYWYSAQFINKKNNQLLFFFLCIGITLLVSWFTYHYYEKTFTVIQKRILRLVNDARIRMLKSK
ncbi:acyltransferase family protein [Winogradskyella vincentii]|uniref:Acyltransferase n=1 Tax=Winogradskyella vincentii TaxID=2877122 RepID=A0ABS7Y2M2_9FLAO|nr:acyltransferase [Winogradskyella vincentii]MCA0153510.1 acyltransferase [Winogradskyella vincentii]